MLNSVHCEKTSESCLKKLPKKALVPSHLCDYELFFPPYILETDFAGLVAAKQYHL